MESIPGELRETGRSDPLAAHYGKPLIGEASTHVRYLGRVVSNYTNQKVLQMKWD